jgi:hypothetical protein
MKTIIPKKLVVAFDKDGNVSSSILHYMIDEDGAVENKYYTMSVKAAINLDDMSKALTDAKGHAEMGEKINDKSK